MCLLKQKRATIYKLQEYHRRHSIWIERPFIFSSFTEAHNWMQQHFEMGTRFKITKGGQIILSGTK